MTKAARTAAISVLKCIPRRSHPSPLWRKIPHERSGQRQRTSPIRARSVRKPAQPDAPRIPPASNNASTVRRRSAGKRPDATGQICCRSISARRAARPTYQTFGRRRKPLGKAIMLYLRSAALVSLLLVSPVTAQSDDSHVFSFVVPASSAGIASIVWTVRDQCQKDDVISVSVDGNFPVSIAIVAMICDAKAQIVFAKDGNEFMCIYRGRPRSRR